MSTTLASVHGAAVAALRIFAETITPREVAHAFVASLSSRDLARRSALGSYAIARVLPEHPLDPQPDTYATICRSCGWAMMPRPEEEEDPVHVERERRKYGGVRHGHMDYATLDLSLFRDSPRREPTADDWRILQMIFRTPALLAPTAKPVDFTRALKDVLPSNKYEREILVQILGYAGVLSAPDNPRVFDILIAPNARELPNTHYADWPFPVTWWRAGHSLRADALSFWFPEISAPDGQTTST